MFNDWNRLKLPEGSLSWSNVALGKFKFVAMVFQLPASCQLIFAADLGNFPADWLPSCNSGLHELSWICWICPRWVWFFCWFIHHLLYVSSSLMAFSKSTRTSPVVFHSGELWRCVEVHTRAKMHACQNLLNVAVRMTPSTNTSLRRLHLARLLGTSIRRLVSWCLLTWIVATVCGLSPSFIKSYVSIIDYNL